MPAHVSRTPFGNPDGSRSDIREVVDNFITFEDLPISTDLGMRPDDLSRRVIVGAKGSGKTVYLRRLRAAASQNASIYADIVQQDLPATSNIVKFCQCFGRHDLTEKWMQLWYCAIMASLVTHLLHSKQLAPHLTRGQREELEGYPEEILPRRRREVSVYSQVTDIIQRFHTAHAFSRYFDHPAWAELASSVNEIISTLPPIYFFIDSVDEEYASAPMYWLQCQKGLFFRAMRFLRDQHFGGRLHVIVCVRDHVLASVLRGEHQNRYRGEPHILTLGWEYASAEFFLKKKVSRLGPEYLLRPRDGEPPEVDHWLGHTFIENRGRGIREPILTYFLRHTRLLPRDIVILGNKLSELAAVARLGGGTEVPPEAVRQCVREVARSFGNEQLAICANHIASSGMPADAARKGYAEIYTGDTEFSRGLMDHLINLVQAIGKDRFDRNDLLSASRFAGELFGEGSDAFSVLWQNRLLGYVDATPDGPTEVFFSELNSDHFNLPLDRSQYVFHSSMIDSAGIRPVGPPVGQGAMNNPASAAKPGTTSSPIRVGSYPILGVIGRGGMGTVYLAEDPRLRRRVAIKMVPEATSMTAADRARFTREAQILANLNHPNIATLYSLEEDGGAQFITMEYVLGRTLRQCIEEKPLDLARSLRICRQIGGGLIAAHRQGVIHRDLKPSNIMVTEQDHVKVLDFGLAKVVKSVAGSSDATWTITHPTSRHTVAGTLGYMSPEQLQGLEVDGRCDVWAFGCCLYECISGRMAFSGGSDAERVAATLERQPDLSAFGELPEPVLDVLRQSFEKDPTRRLSSVEAAVEMLDRVALPH